MVWDKADDVVLLEDRVIVEDRFVKADGEKISEDEKKHLIETGEEILKSGILYFNATYEDAFSQNWNRVYNDKAINVSFLEMFDNKDNIINICPNNPDDEFSVDCSKPVRAGSEIFATSKYVEMIYRNERQTTIKMFYKNNIEENKGK